jgi:hypothetical protein
MTGTLQEIVHGDAIEPERMPWLATALVGVDEPALIIIEAPSVKQLEPQVRPWSPEPSYAPFTPLLLAAPVERNGAFVIVKLTPLKEASEHLLLLPVTFDHGDVAYYWRLQPAK